MRLPLNVPFRDLATPTLDATLAWVNSHDWGGQPATYDHASGFILCQCAVMTGTGWEVETMPHETLADIRDWAGY